MLAKIKPSAPFLWLTLAGILTVFCFGRFAFPLAPWLAPIFLARWFRTQPLRRGILLGWAVIGVAAAFANGNVIPVPTAVEWVMMFFFAILTVAIYLLDRWIIGRIRGFLGTLALPCASVAYQFYNAMTSPYGSWGADSYIQTAITPLLQSASLFGIFGLMFLMYWMASVVSWAWEREFAWPKIRIGVLAFAAVLVALFGFGIIRLAAAPEPADKVKVAVVSAPTMQKSAAMFRSYDAYSRLLQRQGLSPAEREFIRAGFAGAQAELLQLTAGEAANGAKIIVWAEGAGFAFEEDADSFIREGQALAKENGVYLGMSIVVIREKELHLNEVVMIGPDGAIAWTYEKSFPVFPSEAALMVAGDGIMRTIDTPYGRVGVAICHDMDHHQFVQQAGTLGVDILFVPTGDWPTVKYLHQDMAAFRAVEQGLTVVRATKNGLSSAIDPYGRITASFDRSEIDLDQEQSMFTKGAMQYPFGPEGAAYSMAISTRRTGSLYSQIGDAFAWSCCFVLACLIGATIIIAIRGRKKS